jgi:hypothetical protein
VAVSIAAGVAAITSAFPGWHVNRVELTLVEAPDDYVTVVLPEFVPARWWHHLFHNQRALLIKGALLFRPRTVVTSVPFHLSH